MLLALGDLVSLRTKWKQETLDALTQLLKYTATHQNSTVCFRRSRMILHIHSDGYYLWTQKARSQARRNCFLLSNTANPTKFPTKRPVHVIFKILCNVMGSAAETEVGASYINDHEDIIIQQALEEMGHPQSPTPKYPEPLSQTLDSDQNIVLPLLKETENWTLMRNPISLLKPVAGVHCSRVLKIVRCCDRKQLYRSFTKLSDFQKACGMELQENGAAAATNYGCSDQFLYHFHCRFVYRKIFCT